MAMKIGDRDLPSACTDGMVFDNEDSEPGATIRDLTTGISLADAFKRIHDETEVPYGFFSDEDADEQ